MAGVWAGQAARADRWVSDAEIAEVTYTAFASKKNRAMTIRLNPPATIGQDELLVTWRHHVIFTDSPFNLLQAEAQHRDHAIIEQVNADLIDGPLARLPSGAFTPNGHEAFSRVTGDLGQPP
ncbi:hypothetical protein ACQP2T_59410 [Nonomuraea sp. CA-143628]|uniref:hypothetical protein n=1 Tax=Nonomuraea sp. CA-143628 TaxID=3239997 RepID=UPI003D8F28F6